MNNRRLLFIVGLVLLFSIVILVWYFVYVTPAITPSLAKPTNSLPTSPLTKGFQFIFGGGGPDTNNASTGSNQTTGTTSVPTTLQALTKVWDKPATGQTFVTRQILLDVFSTTTTKGTTTPLMVKKTIRATSTIFMFVDRATGYIYEQDLKEGVTRQVTNTTVLGVHDAYIFENGTRVAIRSFDQDKQVITTVLAIIPNSLPNGSPQSLTKMTSLPLGITSIATNKKGTLLSYLVPSTNGSAIYTITAKGGGLVSTSPFKEWSLSYGGDTLYATSNPSAYVLGMTVSLPSFEYRTGDKTGLMSNPGEKGTFLSSVWTDRGLVAFISQSQKEIVLSSPTLASKCVWGVRDFLLCAVPVMIPIAEEGLPDDWFQGRTHFTDTLKIVDTTSGATYPLYSFNESDGEMDITNPVLSPDNVSMGFIQKQNGSLWLLRTNLISVE
ncbi:MAG: hypothetical protein WC444_02975 [Candidatus Paceibacterota bacterium]